MPAPLLLLIMLYFCKQRAAPRRISLWRSVERTHPFQHGSMLFIYGGAAAAGVGPLQKHTWPYEIIKNPEGFLRVRVTKGFSERNSISV